MKLAAGQVAAVPDLRARGHEAEGGWEPADPSPDAVSAADVATATLAGIERNQLLVMPSPDSAAHVLARAERLVGSRGGGR